MGKVRKTVEKEKEQEEDSVVPARTTTRFSLIPSAVEFTDLPAEMQDFPKLKSHEIKSLD